MKKNAFRNKNEEIDGLKKEDWIDGQIDKWMKD